MSKLDIVLKPSIGSYVPMGIINLLSFPEFSYGHLFCHFILLGFMQMQVTIFTWYQIA
jgi:hypothetical protein